MDFRFRAHDGSGLARFHRAGPASVVIRWGGMKSFIIAYLASGIAMLGIDIVWLSLTANRLYKPQLGDLLLPTFKPAPAAIFYLIYVFGIVMLAVLPAIAERRMTTALLRGALLGLVAYATYDLTNQATIRNWSPLVTIADLCWGTFLTAFAATIGYWVTIKFGARLG
jgi:uncharacterized membrane protein